MLHLAGHLSLTLGLYYPEFPYSCRRVRLARVEYIGQVLVDAQIAFGRLVLVTLSVSTGAIAERIDAAETKADLADDYARTLCFLSERFESGIHYGS